MRLHSVWICLAVGLLSGPLAGVAADGRGYENAAIPAGPWKPQGPSQAPRSVKLADGKGALRFEAAFSRSTDWRVFWDLGLTADWSASEHIQITLRAANPGAVAEGTLYLRSGPGWYRLPPFAVSREWAVVTLNKAQAATEGAPTGWHAVDGLRLAFTPAVRGDKRVDASADTPIDTPIDTTIDITSLIPLRGLPAAHMGTLGGHADLAHASSAFRAASRGQPQQADVQLRLQQAEALAAQVSEASPAQQALILQARERVAQAYALLQAPKPDEFRGLWVHHGDGPRALGAARVKRWREALPEMKAQGYNAVLPNVLWSGVAFYRSKLVPPHAGVAQDGDYLQEILDAAKPLGMQVHAWKVMWQFSEGWQAAAGVSQPFRAAGRLQVDAQGRELPWLCPCDERNRQYELGAIQELATAYAIDGIHLDYLRWDGDAVSFSAMCRQRFEDWSKTRVKNWPQDVLAAGPLHAQWQGFKRDVITSFLRETRQALKRIKPALQLSVAVFPDAAQAQKAVSQDWPLWAREGLVDWIASMTYTEDAAGFKAAVQRQQALMVNPAVKLYPGLQFTLAGGRTLALEAAVGQIKAVRDLGLQGFAVFEWRDHLQDTIGPYLRAGLLREGPYVALAHHQRALPAYAQPASGQPGAALNPSLSLQPAGDGSVLLDDFEDGTLINRAQGRWGIDVDPHGLGTRAGPLPLRVQPGGARGSRYSLQFKGHLGKSTPPWPYAVLHSALNAERAPVDLSPFRGIAFFARSNGNGNGYEVVLRQRGVKDFGYYRATFKVGNVWQRVDLQWKDFKQPDWAQPAAQSFVDVDRIDFSPSGISDADFELSIDDVVLRK